MGLGRRGESEEYLEEIKKHYEQREQAKLDEQAAFQAAQEEFSRSAAEAQDEESQASPDIPDTATPESDPLESLAEVDTHVIQEAKLVSDKFKKQARIAGKLLLASSLLAGSLEVGFRLGTSSVKPGGNEPSTERVSQRWEWNEEDTMKMAEENPISLLKEMDRLKHQPFAERAIRLAAEPRFYAFLKFYPKIKDAGYASQILEQGLGECVNQFPLSVIEHYPNFADFPRATEYLARAVGNVKNQHDLLYHLDKLQDLPNFLEVAKPIIEYSKTAFPHLLIKKSEVVRELPEGNKAIEDACWVLARDTPDALVALSKHYRHLSNYQEILNNAVSRSSSDTKVGCFDDYRDLPNSQDYLRQGLVDAQSEVIMASWLNVKDLPEADEVKHRAAQDLAWRNPSSFLFHLNVYKAEAYIPQLVAQVVENYPQVAMEYGPNLKTLDSGQQLLEQASRLTLAKSPQDFIRRYWVCQSENYAEELFASALVSDPGAVAFEISDNQFREHTAALSEALNSSDKPEAKVVIELIDRSDYSSDNKDAIALFMPEIASGQMTIEDAKSLCAEEKSDEFLTRLIAMRADRGRSAQGGLERWLKVTARSKVWEINQLHDSPDQARFASVAGSDAKELYTLIVYGEDEAYTSSYNGLMNRLLSRMQTEQLSLTVLLAATGDNQYRSFIKQSLSFDRLNDLLGVMGGDEKQQMLEKFVRNIDQESNMIDQAVSIADCFAVIKDPEVLKILQDAIKREYHRVAGSGNKQAQKLYGLLASMFGDRATIDPEFFREMTERYKLPNLVDLPQDQLFNAEGVNVQRYYFYNDKDGQDSFNHFLAKYRGKQYWEIDNSHPDYVRFIGIKNGRKIEKYANRPEKGYDGIGQVDKLLNEKKWEPSIVHHRGHSYHADDTLNRLNPSVKIAIFGSCGSYNNLERISNLAPESQILSTKGTGKMRINETIIWEMDEQIFKGGGSWQEVWRRAGSQLKDEDDFRRYISPDRNLAHMFVKAAKSAK